ncbi:MAG: NAD(P)H-dependent glycerol-3-phosphate dehydrogenase [Thermodesulfovibrionia bacterium]|nr:NAD(P)H-dependent glycerol-3-phosphate dehydrogenase [Thermodesulfovibrionia bacterium]
MKKIAVIGAGSWGTALAFLLGEKGYDVSLWVYEPELADEIAKSRVNSKFLPDAALPQNITPSSSMRDVMKDAEVVLSVVPTQHTRRVFKEAVSFIPQGAHIVTASKGIENGTLLTVSQIIEEMTGRKASALSGPSFAKEVIKKLPTAVTLACESEETGRLLQKIFNTDHFRVYTNTDVLGVELGGALKNVMAIASGISDGLGLGSSARAALITRGLEEIIRLGIVMGADEKTFRGLSGMGDLVLTCTGVLSRNYTVGTRLGKGEKIKDIISSMAMVAEGVATSESAYELSRKYRVEMPVVEQVYKTINQDKSPRDAVKELMARSLKAEH